MQLPFVFIVLLGCHWSHPIITPKARSSWQTANRDVILLLTGHVYIQVSLRRESPPFFHHQISHRCNEQALILTMVMGHVATSFWSFPNVGAGKDMIKSAFKAGDRIVPTTLLKSPVRLYTLIRQLKWQTHIKDINRQMSGSFPANGYHC